MKTVIHYILKFLTGATDETLERIGYTHLPTNFSQYSLVILDSGFFNEGIYGTEKSLPKLPLNQWEEVPILFGEGVTEYIDGTLIIHPDLIAGTYFLISRYEEMVRKQVRDQHGRFPGKESLPYKAGFIDKPIIEEWGKQLRACMRKVGLEVEEPPQKIGKIYLTHDIDQLAHYRSIRGMLGGVLRGIKRRKEGRTALRSYFGGLVFDPWYTFPYLYKLNDELRQVVGKERCEVVVFVRAGGKMKEDKPFVNLIHPDYKTLLRYTKRKKNSIGLHASYEAGLHPELIVDEKKWLEKQSRTTITCNRNHYLSNREPDDFELLISCGISDDFSMGYADIAGFRLGTCRSVQWINPRTKELTPLQLHSLVIMDCTLHEKRYMYMNAFEAYEYSIRLIQCVEHYNGDLVLLWHNTLMERSAQLYHRKLYKDILKYLQSK